MSIFKEGVSLDAINIYPEALEYLLAVEIWKIMKMDEEKDSTSMQGNSTATQIDF